MKSRNVKFINNNPVNDVIQNMGTKAGQLNYDSDPDLDLPQEELVQNEEVIQEDTPQAVINNDEADQPLDEGRYPTHTRNTPSHLDDYIMCSDIDYLCMVSYNFIPTTYNEAVTCDDSQKWKSAMDSEINSLVENNTFTEVLKSDCIKIVGGCWVYIIKDGTNSEDIFKACLRC